MHGKPAVYVQSSYKEENDLYLKKFQRSFQPIAS